MTDLAVAAAVPLQEWNQHAACVASPKDWFFPDRWTTDDQVEVAKNVCRGCPVVLLCRAHAFSAPETLGIWGGLTAAERGFHSVFSRSSKLTPTRIASLLRGDDL